MFQNAKTSFKKIASNSKFFYPVEVRNSTQAIWLEVRFHKENLHVQKTIPSVAARASQWVLWVVLGVWLSSSLTVTYVWLQATARPFFCVRFPWAPSDKGDKASARHQGLSWCPCGMAVSSLGARDAPGFAWVTAAGLVAEWWPAAVRGPETPPTLGAHPRHLTENEINVCKMSQSQELFFPLTWIGGDFWNSPSYLSASQENSLGSSRQYVRLQRKMYWCLTGSRPTRCW